MDKSHTKSWGTGYAFLGKAIQRTFIIPRIPKCMYKYLLKE